MTLAELKAAYGKGDLTEPLILDNDHAAVYDTNADAVFELHPEELLRAALDLLGIPWSEA